jgi:chitobiase/beta-hexosaminidase-like protein/F5/8 type C domain-containing protein
VYIIGATMNGAAYTKSYLNYAAVTAGGALTFEMSEGPSTSWANAPADRPRSSIAGPSIVAAPFVSEGARIFRGRTAVRLDHTEPGIEMHYTTDGSVPTAASPRYGEPVTLTESTTMRVLARRANGDESLPFEVAFHKIPEGRTIALSAKYANQYSAGGDDALIDGLRGSLDFRDGRWQGYRGADLTATIDLGSIQDLRRVTMAFLRDVNSWIMLPKRVSIAVSPDNANWNAGPAWDVKISDRDPAPLKHEVMVDFPGARARYVRVTVQRYGPLPDWHPGRGEEAWFFLDEIVIDR